MKKKYIVELTEDERSTLREVVKKLKGTSGKVKRANILLKADAGGPSLKERWASRGARRGRRSESRGLAFFGVWVSGSDVGDLC